MPPRHVEVKKREGRVGFLVDTPRHVEYGLHEHTIAQEEKTIANRHLFDTPEPDEGSEAWRAFLESMESIDDAIGIVKLTPIREMYEQRSGRRKRRFWLGAKQLLEANFQVSQKDSRITEMQKLEFYEASKLAGKEDRGIQFRSVKYNVAIARLLHSVEKRLRGLHMDGFHPIAKGLTPRERASRLFNYAAHFAKPVFVLLDHSRFDAHVHWKVLREEIRGYLRNCPKHLRRYFKRILKMQLKNMGVSAGGIRYLMKGKRSSGDVNTGLGNSKLNYAFLRSYIMRVFVLLLAEGYRDLKWRALIDGDDSVLILEADVWKRMQEVLPIKEHMLALGMVTEVEETCDIWKAEFCQSRPVVGPGGGR